MASSASLMAQSDQNTWRDDFPILQKDVNGKRFAYLDSASSAQKPRAVMDAMRDVTENHYANIHRGLYSHSHRTTTMFENVRPKVAAFLGAADHNEIVFTRNTTEAINLVAHSWGRAHLSAGDEIILTQMEHHANIVPWQILEQEIGIVIKYIPLLDDGSLDLAAYEKMLRPETKFVGCVHISNALGIVNDVKHITHIAKDFDPKIKVLIDGTQAAVHIPVNVNDIGCDFYTVTGHKLYGPTGIGVLWGRYDVLQSMTPYQGGGDMIETVTFDGSTYKDAPARFEAGTPAILEVIGLGAAIDYLDGIGMQDIHTHENELSDYMHDRLKEIDGLRLYGTNAQKIGIACFTADWGHPSDVTMILDQCGVAVRSGHHCCMPLMAVLEVDATIRASLGLYSTRDDIDLLIDGLNKAKGMLS